MEAMCEGNDADICDSYAHCQAFYTKDNLPEIPGKLSLARKLIDDWLGENSQTDLG
jgi:NAD+ diphosphatase